MADTAHVDTFARDNLPPEDQWPAFLSPSPEFQYPERLNCAAAFLDRWVDEGRGDEPCLISPAETLTYRALRERVNRICQCAGRQARLRARQPRAAAFGQQPDDGGRLSGGPEGRRRRRRHHASAARQGDRLSAEEGEDNHCALRSSPRGGDGARQDDGARSAACGVLGIEASPTASRH